MPIAGAKERTILAHLIANADRVVPSDDLIDELWGDHPPRTAEKTLRFLRFQAAPLPGARSFHRRGDRDPPISGRWIRTRSPTDTRSTRSDSSSSPARDIGSSRSGTPERRRPGARRGTGSVAGHRVSGLSVHRFGGSRGRTARRAPAHGDRGSHRCEARGRRPGPARRRPRSDGSGGTAAGTSMGPADACPVSSGTPGGGAPSVHARSRSVGRRARDRAGSRPPTVPGARSSLTTPRWVGSGRRIRSRFARSTSAHIKDSRDSRPKMPSSSSVGSTWSPRRSDISSGEVPRTRRCVRQWEVVPPACGPPPCASVGCAAGQRSMGVLRDPPRQPSTGATGSRDEGAR